MKHIINILLAVLVFGSASAQMVMDKGYIKMEMTDITSTGQQAAELGMLKGAEMEVHFSGDKVLTSINLMGGMMNMSTLVDKKANKTDILINAMGSKMWAEETNESAKTNEVSKAVEGMVIKYDESQTKEILGYKVTKATITRADQPGMVMEAWITEDIKIDSDFIPGMEDFKLKGYPLEITIDTNGTTMSIVTRDIKNVVDMNKFILDTAGAEKIKMSDLSGMMGGMGM
ncbi:MAG: GLPGLI family protein [Saprospiraceae bacterium]|jgi:GLPGLI family protein|tara:strand:+ start:750 stop:1439 length:690 start_codon:yes stop_codon:yes gene_type:complete